MRRLLILPVAAYPYLFVFDLLICGILSALCTPLGNNEVTNYILFAYFIIVLLRTPVCSILYLRLTRGQTEKTLKAALLSKLLHIPAYTVIFIFGLIAGLMFFMTFPLILMMILFDLSMLWNSSLVSVVALVRCLREENQPTSYRLFLIVAIICQFFFCADVISLLVIHHQQKKLRKTYDAHDAI